jgi:hypothetical protein
MFQLIIVFVLKYKGTLLINLLPIFTDVDHRQPFYYSHLIKFNKGGRKIITNQRSSLLPLMHPKRESTAIHKHDNNHFSRNS